ncbi:GT4 family glycosyltransferase PelF [Chitinimonas sp. BJYL2]|uniref:GT4 family glycosyltransferase PelF n=1 Tax=Chitinimonas sp. BJYL2 TaxID=2976696 RepID=UPI0022B58E45|nr:GT4 family glycosyltransferase PelF [Chitinimonas sp. BJYL2]
MTVLRQAESADIALLLEGTYPFISGGVSSWVHQMLNAFPEYRFAIVFIGSKPEEYGDPRYQMPENVVHLETHFLHSKHGESETRPRKGDPATMAAVRDLHDWFRSGKACGGEQVFSALAGLLLDKRDVGEAEFLYARTSWDYICEQYRERCTDPSFVDYFWTVRSMHEPLWMLARIVHGLIPVRLYHTVSTGYAGYLGALLKHRHGKPLLTSEHGIYTKERKIDLFQSNWVKDNRDTFQKSASELSYFRNLWIRFFQGLGLACYEASDKIVALYENNRLRQVDDGAPPERTLNIPNGIKLQRFAPIRPMRQDSPESPPILCLLGRVVPIKDIKTFIRAMRTVANELPHAEGWIVGPDNEDPGYAQECRNLVESLGLINNVKFLGFQKPEDIFPKVKLLILSSISEALPLSLLEGYAAGIPAVTTDVGSCSQLVYGLTEADQALGPSGAVVPIANPEALGRASLTLLNHFETWQACQAAAIARVERFYTDDLMFGRYRELYQGLLDAPASAGEGAA